MTRRLLILPNNPGDVLMGLHAAASLKALYPEDPLAYVVDSECASLVQGHPCIDLPLVLPRAAMRNVSSLPDAARLLSDFLHLCEAYSPDIVINLFQGEYGALLCALIPARERLGCYYDATLGRPVIRDPWSQYLHAIPARRASNPFHVIDIYLRICSAVHKCPIYPVPPPVSSEESTRLRNLLPDSPCLALQPGSAMPGKQWPVDYWQALAIELSLQGYTLMLLGSPAEHRLCETIAQTPGARCLNFSGHTSLPGLGIPLRHALLLVTGDTFAMHLAALCATPCLALFGPSNPVETGPYRPGSITLRAPLAADSTSSLPMRDTSIMRSLYTQTVLDILLGHVKNATLYSTCWTGSSMTLLHSHENSSLPAPADPRAIDLHLLSAAARALLQEQQRLLSSPAPFAHLQAIQQNEENLAKHSDQNMSMEMYRMSLNALPNNPEAHIALRLTLVNTYNNLLNVIH